MLHATNAGRTPGIEEPIVIVLARIDFRIFPADLRDEGGLGVEGSNATQHVNTSFFNS